ncbi:MAG TPA: acyltransferase [Caulobacteraceae bacterium]
MKTYYSIQYLRAAAAIAVAVYHAFQWMDGGFEAGRAGVDVFFVISGFIMWSITAGRQVRPRSFLWRRLTRVAPTYWVITLVLAATAVAWPAFLPNVQAGWSHMLLSMAFITHRGPNGLPFPVLPAGWTLNYEAEFYLIFAVGLLMGETRRLAFVTAALVAIGVLGVLDPPLYTLGANLMMMEFAAGLWLGKLATDRVLPGALIGASLAGLALALFAATNSAWFGDTLMRPLFWGLPALMLVGGAVALEARGKVLRWRWLKALGDASYSIYLCHAPATALVAHAVGTSQPLIFAPAAIAASIAAGLACRRFVERPLLHLLRRREAPVSAPGVEWRPAPGTD